MGLLLFNSTTPPPRAPCAFSLSTVMWLRLTCSVELFLSKPHTSRESAPLPHVCNMCVCSSAHMYICVCVCVATQESRREVCVINIAHPRVFVYNNTAYIAVACGQSSFPRRAMQPLWYPHVHAGIVFVKMKVMDTFETPGVIFFD